jgi:hypothetical protein
MPQAPPPQNVSRNSCRRSSVKVFIARLPTIKNCDSLCSQNGSLLARLQSNYKEITMATQASAVKMETGEKDAVIRAMQSYIDGVRLGSGKVMRSGFHENATIFGHYPGGVMANPISALFDWIDKNGPSPDLQTEFTKIEVVESIAVVHLEVRDLSGALAGTGVRMSDIFTLLRKDEGWKITQKAFHWHNR